MVLGGHSHTNERPWLIDGYSGHSDTFNELEHLIDDTEVIPGVSAYNKTLGQVSHEGTVYVVASRSGKIGPGSGISS